jgi:hypothetical protein
MSEGGFNAADFAARMSSIGHAGNLSSGGEGGGGGGQHVLELGGPLQNDITASIGSLEHSGLGKIGFLPVFSAFQVFQNMGFVANISNYFMGLLTPTSILSTLPSAGAGFGLHSKGGGQGH